MKTNDLTLLAYCGLYCGACSFKVAFQEQNRGHLFAMPQKYAEYKDSELEDCAGWMTDAVNVRLENAPWRRR